MNSLLAWTFGPTEMIVVGVLALLLFGASRLPQLGRSLGRGIVEFKKGVKGLEDDIDTSDRQSSDPPEPPRPPQRIGSATPKFEDRATDSHGQRRDA
jgi:sec-independent protein translocase protein TatA